MNGSILEDQSQNGNRFLRMGTAQTPTELAILSPTRKKPVMHKVRVGLITLQGSESCSHIYGV